MKQGAASPNQHYPVLDCFICFLCVKCLQALQNRKSSHSGQSSKQKVQVSYTWVYLEEEIM